MRSDSRPTVPWKPAGPAVFPPRRYRQYRRNPYTRMTFARAPRVRRGKLKSYVYVRSLLAAMLCTLAVLALTHLPPQFMPQRLPVYLSDKLVHAMAYGLIAASFLGALRRQVGWRLRISILLGIIVVGLVDEMTQPLVGRQASSGDLAADVAGILAATALWLSVRLCRFGISRWRPSVQLAASSRNTRVQARRAPHGRRMSDPQ